MAKKKDLKIKHPKYNIDVIEVLSEMDPTNSNKYLPFMIKCTADWVEWIQSELKNETFKEMYEVIQDFEDLSQRNLLENKDIYAYESNQDIIEAVKVAKEKITRSEVKKKETEILYEDERWSVLIPLSTRSSNLYGKSTKWTLINGILVGIVFTVVALSSGSAISEGVGAGIAISLLPPVTNCGVTLMNSTINKEDKKEYMKNTMFITILNILGIIVASLIVFTIYCKFKYIFKWE